MIPVPDDIPIIKDVITWNMKHEYTDPCLGGKINTLESLMNDLTGLQSLCNTIIKKESELVQNPNNLHFQEDSTSLENMKRRIKSSWSDIFPLVFKELKPTSRLKAAGSCEVG